MVSTASAQQGGGEHTAKAKRRDATRASRERARTTVPTMRLATTRPLTHTTTTVGPHSTATSARNAASRGRRRPPHHSRRSPGLGWLSRRRQRASRAAKRIQRTMSTAERTTHTRNTPLHPRSGGRTDEPERRAQTAASDSVQLAAGLALRSGSLSSRRRRPEREIHFSNHVAAGAFSWPTSHATRSDRAAGHSIIRVLRC